MRTREMKLCALMAVAGCAHQQAPSGHPAEHAGSERASAEVIERELDTQDGQQVSADDLGAPRPGVPAENSEQAGLNAPNQGESEADRALLQRVRKAVIEDESLSFDAKNIDIVTRDGQVTLRGAVANAQERDTLEQTAREAGGKRVRNQLEVAN